MGFELVLNYISQILQLIPGSKILACAPSNSAVDLMTTRLLQHVDKKDIFRLNASSRDWRYIEDPVKVKYYITNTLTVP